jgi:hypothetical protein
VIPPKNDDNMELNIEKDMGLFIVKANRAYMDLLRRAEESSFAEILPQTLKANRDDMLETLNPLMRFLNNTDIVEYDPNFQCDSREFCRAAHTYMKDQGYSFKNIDDSSLAAYLSMKGVKQTKTMSSVNGKQVSKPIFHGVQLKQGS